MRTGCREYEKAGYAGVSFDTVLPGSDGLPTAERN
jgi:hypothetical protein